MPVQKRTWCNGEKQCPDWTKCLDSTWLTQPGDVCACGPSTPREVALGGDWASGSIDGEGRPSLSRPRKSQSGLGHSSSQGLVEQNNQWSFSPANALALLSGLKVTPDPDSYLWVSTTDVQKQVALTPQPLSSVSVVFQSGTARGLTAGDPPNATAAWVFETACNTHGDFLQEAIRRYSKRQRHWLHPFVEMEDLYQEAYLELRILCQRRPLDLFGNPSSIRKMLNCLARRIVTNQVRKSKAGKRDGRGANIRLSRLAGLKMENRESNQLDLLALIEAARKILERLRLPDREAVRLRMLNYTWEEITRQIGGSPDSNRMAYVRAIQRLRERLDPEKLY